MEQTAAPPPPPPTAVTAATTTAHPASLDSSPRSRTTDSWIEDCSLQPPGSTTAAAAAVATGGLTKLRLMCSYGGHIVPRPHDKSMCYVGGDTRIVVVDRRITLSDLTLRLAKTLLRSSSTVSGTSSFTIKYQLPSEDLDSLISVTTDEDLENMIEEYDRLNVNSSSRIRLFLFPTKPESVTSIGSLLESSVKSEDWFLNALNGTLSGFSDTSSVNCLLGLEDDVSVQEKKDVNQNQNQNHKGVICKNYQDVQSVPDSPMLETTSSFGSASSSPVTVHVEDQPKVAGGIEEQFSKLSVQQHVKQKEDVNFVAEPAPVVISGDPIGSKVPITENPNPNPKNLLSEEEKSEQVFQMAHHNHQQHQPDSISSDGSRNNSPSAQKPPVNYQDLGNILDQNTRIQVQQVVQDSAYLLSPPTARVDQQTHQSHHQPQFIHTAVPPPQYLPHHPSRALPMAPFYQIYPSQTQQNFVYYMPARQPPQGYTLPLQADAAPPNNQVPPPSGVFTVPRDVQSATKTEPPPGVYRTTANSGAPAPQLVQIPYSQQQILPQFFGYSHIHQPTQPVPSGGGGSYVYEFTDPSQKGQYIYSPAQPLPPQSAAQHQTMTSNIPVEAQANSMNQQVKTSQP
ncbi:hypothetical protein SSX86_032868 [Deinandra increscens subsp. villosa]|uniref:PB1 domain-containing protein n=1 Tax=Deinandra increscens subsp. villosa TaxID=3103831 RepID=A0AAP0C2E8_9ASTR